MNKKSKDISDIIKDIFTSEYLGIVEAIAILYGSIIGAKYSIRLENHCLNGHSHTYHRMGYDQNGDFHIDYETKTLQAEICESKGFDDGYMIKTIFKHILITFVLALAITILCEYLSLAIKYRICLYGGLAILVILSSILISSSKINNENKEQEDKKKAEEVEQLKKEQIEPFKGVWFNNEFNSHYDVTISIFDDNACYYGYYTDSSKSDHIQIDRTTCKYSYEDNKVTIDANESFTCTIKDKKLVCNDITFDKKVYH